MRNEDWRLVADDELQQVTKELVICLKTLLVCESDLLVFANLVVEVYIHEPYFVGKSALLLETRKVQVSKPKSILMEFRDNFDNLFEKCQEDPSVILILDLQCLHDLIKILSRAILIKYHDRSFLIFIRLQP